MKQKIVLKVQMKCEKCRKKAKEIAAGTDGVTSMSIEGEEKNLVVVIGDGVDSCKLATLLRNKVGHTDLVSLEEVKPKKEEPKPKPEEEPKPMFANQPCQYWGQPFVVYEMDPPPSSSICSTM